MINFKKVVLFCNLRSFKVFLSHYCKIANETSGLIALGILQSVVMAGVLKQEELKGPDWNPVMF
ncbi:hypothetical protein ACUY4R_002192 [Kosakonia sp. BK9b]